MITLCSLASSNPDNVAATPPSQAGVCQGDKRKNRGRWFWREEAPLFLLNEIDIGTLVIGVVESNGECQRGPKVVR